MTEAPGALRRWVLAARPRTLPAAAVPVGVGVMVTRPLPIEWLNFLLCIVVALALQIGTNYANDYSDGVRGTDEVRVGPFRLTASRLVPASWVKYAAWSWFLIAMASGTWLAERTSWWLVAVGLTAVLAGWFYTGGPKPYGYYGFGELFVLIYFGFVATVGSSYAQHRTISSTSWWFGLATGAMACALLEANNLRDITGDQAARKRTLAARLGRARASWLYATCVGLTVVGIAAGRLIGVALVALVVYIPGLRVAFSPRQGRDLLVLLKLSARAQLALGVVLIAVFVTTR
jgi:1,4-dihydroxy-2-naphthoate octaprenyltransferase